MVKVRMSIPVMVVLNIWVQRPKPIPQHEKLGILGAQILCFKARANIFQAKRS
jgi:hypothetical protein